MVDVRAAAAEPSRRSKFRLVNRWMVFLIVLGLVGVTSACGMPTEAPISAVRIGEDGRTVRVVIQGFGDEHHARCLSGARVTASTSTKKITLTVRGVVRDGYGCSRDPLSVVLPEPVDNREVFDHATGKAVPTLAVPMPEPTWLPSGWRVTADNESFMNGDRTKFGWSITVGADPNEPVRVNLFRSGTDVGMRAYTISSMVTVQGRRAATIQLRHGEQAYARSLVMMDETWTLQIDSFYKSADEETIRRIAEGMKPLPFAATIPPPILETPPSGSESTLAGIDGPVTVSGWFSVAADGRAELCESLADDGTCVGDAFEIGWPMNAEPPADLIPIGNRRVSPKRTMVSGYKSGNAIIPDA
jgi:hypothetical protein